MAESSMKQFAVVEEIIVTANRRQEMLQDVPMSIAAFTDKFIKDSGLSDFKSLENYAASLKITPGESSRATSIRIRGIGSAGGNSGIDPSVGVFIDGVYQGRAGMSIGDMLDVERIEVLRGPQGTLYGKNTAAGAISVISKSPTSQFEGAGEVVVGNYNSQEFRGMVNVPLNDEGSAVRLSGYSVQHDGYDDNIFTGEDLNNADKWGFKARAGFETDTMGTFLLTLDHSEDSADCCAPDIITYDGPSMLAIPFSSLESSSGLALPVANPFDHKLSYDRPFVNDVEVEGAALEWVYDMDNDFILTWINAYRTYDAVTAFDSDFSQYNAVFGSTDVELAQTSSEFRVASPEGETVDYQVGVYYYYSDMDTVGKIGMLEDTYNATLADGNFLSALFDPITGTSINTDTNKHETTNYAMFGQGTWNITDEFNATLGLRYTYERKERAGSQLTEPEFFADAPPFGPDILDVDESRSGENVSPAVSVRYFPRPRLMYYASVSQGFKSGGFNQLRTAGGLNTEFDDEKSTNHEMGWKGSWLEGRMQFNGTVYYVDYQDFQSQTFDGSAIAVRNAGSLESYGLELEVQYVPTINLSLGGSMGYNKAEYTEFDDGACTVDQANDFNNALPVPNPFPGAAGCTRDLEGAELDNAPELTVSSFLQYRDSFETWSGYEWFGRLEYIYTDSFFLAQDLDPKLENDATNLFNGRLGITDMDESWEVVLWGRNLTDENYYAAGLDVPILSGYAGYNAPPRTYGVSLRFNF